MSQIFLGLAGNGEKQYLDLALANRHGLIAGATGTGKTVTLQGLAESFSASGVPVFLADVKGDLSGISMPGSPTFKGRIGDVEFYVYNDKHEDDDGWQDACAHFELDASDSVDRLTPLTVTVTSSIFDNLYFDVMSMIQMAALAVVALVLGLFVVRPILAGNGASVAALAGPNAPGAADLPALPDIEGGGI